MKAKSLICCIFLCFHIVFVGESQDNLTPRGYLTTPIELNEIKQKADNGLQPYHNAVQDVLRQAKTEWDFRLSTQENCEDADSPAWLDNSGGIPIIYAKALSYHLEGKEQYAQEVLEILEQIMTEVQTFSLEQQRCRLVLSWGTPELIASADLIEGYWHNKVCTGPQSFIIHDTIIAEGNCKDLFQNWLAKNVYYVVSLTGEDSQSNWGAAATNAMAYTADYLWDREDIVLINRVPPLINEGQSYQLSPAEAYAHANMIALDRMNGYRVEYGSSSSCDYLAGTQQQNTRTPVKSQITPEGIIAEDARRTQYCNISEYNGRYQNYPQIHINNNVQQCELMLRRGDSSCYDNVDMQEIPDFAFVDPNGNEQTTHLYPGRGSIEQAINAVIVTSNTEWRHDAGLEVSYRYYFTHHRSDNVVFWYQEIGHENNCSQGICFATLTHGFAPGETPALPPIVAPPS